MSNKNDRVEEVTDLLVGRCEAVAEKEWNQLVDLVQNWQNSLGGNAFKFYKRGNDRFFCDGEEVGRGQMLKIRDTFIAERVSVLMGEMVDKLLRNED